MAGGVDGTSRGDLTTSIDLERAGRLADVGVLAAGIAHEIRNSLVSVQTFFQLAPIRLDDEEFRTGFLALAHAEVNRVCELVGELLDVARPAPAVLVRADLAQVADTTVRLLMPQARQRQVAMTLECTPGLYVRADVARIKQVLINIVLNALEATPPGGAVRIGARAARHNRRDYGEVTVEDTGTGIPAQIHGEIFTPFVTAKPGGTGLGLAIAQRIVSDHDGFITVDSASDRGTRFTVCLPCAEE